MANSLIRQKATLKNNGEKKLCSERGARSVPPFRFPTRYPIAGIVQLFNLSTFPVPGLAPFCKDGAPPESIAADYAAR